MTLVQYQYLGLKESTKFLNELSNDLHMCDMVCMYWHSHVLPLPFSLFHTHTHITNNKYTIYDCYNKRKIII